jgi:abortive infection bacteriophage resistance protein
MPQPSHSGLYELVLAMKYLRPDNSSWEDFSADLKKLLAEYDSYIKLSAINFPTDWADHLNVTA